MPEVVGSPYPSAGEEALESFPFLGKEEEKLSGLSGRVGPAGGRAENAPAPGGVASLGMLD